MVLVSVLFAIILILGIIENYFHINNIRRIKYRILVNGTRGKTTVSRIIINALNIKGIKTIGRTTGSEASIVLPDNSTVPFKRKKDARITEMISFFNFCRKNNAQCAVVECMALLPENQRVFASKLVKPTHTVITNSYVDHIPEMGDSISSTQWALSNSIYKDSSVFVTEKEYAASFSKCTVIEDYFAQYNNLPANKESMNLSYALLKEFGISKEEVIEAASTLAKDVGLHDRIDIKDNLAFYPYFSINDFTTMSRAISSIANIGKINLIFNNRKDREYRILQFEKALYENIEKINKVYVIGDYPKKVIRYCQRYCKVEYIALDVDELKRIIREDNDAIYLGLGNIKGPGEALVREFLIKES